MKANELMIGDWVKINDVDYPYPAQIGGIIKKHGTFYAHFPQWDLNVIDEKLKPIPLTPEILEKNGLKRDIGGNIVGEYFAEDEHYYLEISIEDNKIYWSINCEEYHIIQLKYVHQLQHALRLCGINKEIKL